MNDFDVKREKQRHLQRMQFDFSRSYPHNYGQIPDYMQEGIIEYIVCGRPCGGFLESVISNDLMEACARADINNLPVIPVFVSYFYNHAPIPCWGSAENYRNWIEAGGLVGLREKMQDEKESQDESH